MTKEQIEQIKKLAESHDFKGLPIPQLCELAILGAITRDVWFAQYFQPSLEKMGEAHRAFDKAKGDFLEDEHRRQRADFDQRYPGIM